MVLQCMLRPGVGTIIPTIGILRPRDGTIIHTIGIKTCIGSMNK